MTENGTSNKVPEYEIRLDDLFAVAFSATVPASKDYALLKMELKRLRNEISLSDKKVAEAIKPIVEVYENEIKLVNNSFCDFHIVGRKFIEEYIRKLENAIKVAVAKGERD